MTSFKEGELQLSFGDEWDAEHFDRRGAADFPPKSVSPVDFIAERADELVLVEVKDPSAARAPVANRQDFVEKMKSEELTHRELAPKARTSYGFLHLMLAGNADYGQSVRPPDGLHLGGFVIGVTKDHSGTVRCSSPRHTGSKPGLQAGSHESRIIESRSHYSRSTYWPSLVGC